MDFRKLTPEDAAQYWRVRVEALETEPMAFGMDVEEYRQTSIADQEKRLRELSADSFYMGAFDGDTLVAVATFIRETRVKEAHKAHIYGVFVSAAHRGKGIGGALMTRVLEVVRSQNGLRQVGLAVATTNNSALNLYRSLGFEIWGTEPAALRVAGQDVDEHHMILKLR